LVAVRYMAFELERERIVGPFNSALEEIWRKDAEETNARLREALMREREARQRAERPFRDAGGAVTGAGGLAGLAVAGEEGWAVAGGVGLAAFAGAGGEGGAVPGISKNVSNNPPPRKRGRPPVLAGTDRMLLAGVHGTELTRRGMTNKFYEARAVALLVDLVP